jgi:iron complex transport system substrate-binding protein
MLRRKFARLAGLAGVALVATASALAAGQPPAPGKGFPVTITTAAGPVTLTQRPTRIVSISSTATEDLFAVGAGRQVVAVDDQSLLPKNAPRTKLSGYTPSAEAIERYRPDLVVLAFDTNKIVAALRKLGVPMLFEPPAADLNGVYAQIDQLGRATGHLPQAQRLVGRLRQRVAAIVRSVPHGGRPLTVYHELGPDFYSASSHTFIGRVYSLLGLRNIADAAHKGGDYPKLSAEYIVATNPDLIVLADTVCCAQSAATVAARPGWSGLSAVQHRQVVGVPDGLASYWGPQIVDFLQVVAAHVKAIRSGGG